MAVIKRQAKKRGFKESLIKSFNKSGTNENVMPFVVRPSNHERTGIVQGGLLRWLSPAQASKPKQRSLKKPDCTALQALTTAALVLPGLLSPIAHAAEDDEVDFQYSHYQEGKRAIYGVITDPLTGVNSVSGLKNALNPIEVDSLHGSGKIALTDRIKFAFNYLQDTWSGATPIATAPAAFGGNNPRYAADGTTMVGASPLLQGSGQVFLDAQHNPLLQNFDPNTFEPVYTKNTQLTHTITMASPETRKQGDFKLTHEWDEAALSVGGGLSLEDDYESSFGNIGGRLDLNQKRTTLTSDLSYTNSQTNAILNHDTLPYITKDAYYESHVNTEEPDSAQVLTGTRQDWASHLGVTQILNKNALIGADVGYTRSTGYMANPYKTVNVVFIDPDQQFSAPPGGFQGELKALLEQRPGVRNQLNLGGRYVQYIEPLNAALHFDYRFSTDDWGIHAHTFEADWVQPVGNGWSVTPRIRYYSQSAADFYSPYLITQQGVTSNIVDPVKGQAYTDGSKNGKLYFDDLTGTVPVPVDGDGNPIVNPITGNVVVDANGNVVTDPNTISSLSNATKPFDSGKLPANFSSDQRLSGFGALSGGVTVSKQFAKGLTLETGFEYYTHQGSFKIGGGGEGAYANFDYWTANAALKVNLDALSLAGSGGGNDHSKHGHHSHGAYAPAGVMFDHMLPKAGDMMVGYRYMYGSQGGPMLNGTHSVSDQSVVAAGCGPNPCFLTPDSMSMNMHMLDLMYAPTDWLTLMLMPQFVDMNMSMRRLDGAPPDDDAQNNVGNPVQYIDELDENGNLIQVAQPLAIGKHIPHHVQNGHETGGIGDLGMYALFKLFDNGTHHVHVTAGLSAPTGDVNIQLQRNHQIDGGFIDYGMQLGSGTWDFKPSATYTGHIGQWSWGAQASGTVRMQDHNESGYALGDIFQSTAWGSYSLTHWLTASVRGVYTLQGAIQGKFNGQINQFGSMDYPSNYGGQYWDVGFGLSAVVPSGDLAGNRVAVEWLQPVEDNANGYQLERNGALSATWSVAF